jgi:prolipoprotein diacylglyceryltransferase
VDCLKFYKKGDILVHPILFQIGFLKVYSYGFFMALAILAGTLWLMCKVERKGDIQGE